MLLTVVSLADSLNYNKWKLDCMTPYLDFFNIMTYNYADFFSTVTAHQSNLYSSPNNFQSTSFSTNVAIKDYVRADVSVHKINLSMSLYGRAFQQTNNMRQLFHGVGEDSFEKRIWDYKVLPLSSVIEQVNLQMRVSYSWDKARRLLVNYDTITASNMNIDNIEKYNLEDSMFWKLSENRNNNKSLISNLNLLASNAQNVITNWK